MKFSQVIQVLESAGLCPEPVPVPAGDPEIADACTRTDQVRPGALYCCVRGLKSDGHGYAAGQGGKGPPPFWRSIPWTFPFQWPW